MEEDIVQLRKEDFDELLANLRMQVAPITPLPQTSSNIPPATGIPCTSAMPSSSSKPKFTKPGLSRQFDFNSEILSILSPLVEFAPEERDVKNNLIKFIQLLTQRNGLLAVADSDPDIWEFYEKHSKAESFQSSNPILAASLREKKKKDERKPQIRALVWKTRFQPYSAIRQQPFRGGEAAWAPAYPYFQPFPSYSGYPVQPVQQPVPYPNQGIQSPNFAPPPYPGPFIPQQSGERNLKPMYFNCERFCHLRNQCLFPSTGK
ncbi:hypothetical protein Y032_0009g810 [Ancylostoma ceylanicum]|nr:hypothetical protein Y032_0009g810 [Ancylostoma ceylanicum]